jgi:topoisomerase IV subunit A
VGGGGVVAGEGGAAAQTRAGKQVMVPGDGAVARWCLRATADGIGLLGENRKLLVLPIAEIPEMARGRGVILQKFRDGGLADVRMLDLKQGLSWQAGTRIRTEPDLSAWQMGRGSSGRMAPMGFPQRPVRFP